MSEELIQKELVEHGLPFGVYEFYNIGSTTIHTLKQYRIIPNRDYGELENKKPDGLVVDRRNPNNISVIAVIEFKDPNQFNTPAKEKSAEMECVSHCKGLDAKIGIATDRQEHHWLNPQIPGLDDEDYAVVTREDGYPLSSAFGFSTTVEIEETLRVIRSILDSIDSTNSQLRALATQNPSQLADRVWQNIWLASGENPDACLATFVEIFVFKFLSDLEVLTANQAGARVDFGEVRAKQQALKYYFEYTRPMVKNMFPVDTTDGTGIINGIILDPSVEEHNLLFKRILDQFEEFGPLNNIDPDFKSRLYEKFLKKSISQKNWGQFFTPRNVVKAIVEMSDIDKLQDGSVVHDPACGVGGFILEPYLGKRSADYYINQAGQLTCRLKYVGHDRDSQTIILAKANMLIHLSQLLRENPTISREFAGLFNSTFKSYHTSILGSLSDIPENAYDLLMTNPPYVTAGSSNQKKVVHDNVRLRAFYKLNVTGIEGLFVVKIIKGIKKGRNALIIIPDGILQRSTDVKLRQFIRDNCIINAIVSLPVKTFYSSSKKTYILSLTKKMEPGRQTDPVFTYLVTKTGETLDAKRFPDVNDLPNMVRLYKYFMADKQNFSTDDPKCRIQLMSKFDPDEHWAVDRWWTQDERRALGIEEETGAITLDEFSEGVSVLEKELHTLAVELGMIK